MKQSSLASSSTAILVVSFLILIVGVLSSSVWHYQKKVKEKLATFQPRNQTNMQQLMGAEVNVSSESDVSEGSCLNCTQQETEGFHCSYCERLANIGVNTSMDSNSGDDNLYPEKNIIGEPIIPEWLSSTPDMFYPPSLLTKGKGLGKGNFGAVFEGKLSLGNAVYVSVLFLPLIIIFSHFYI